MGDIHFHKAQDKDLPTILNILEDAFGKEDMAIQPLVKDLLVDESAQPTLSLIVEKQDVGPIGHILFSKVVIKGHEDVKASLLAPLAVVSNHQKTGVGQKLIQEGLKRLKEEGVALVFVLGHIDYYPKVGFVPAGVNGLEAPYPIPVEVADAWMVKALSENALGVVRGQVECARALRKEEYWRE